LLGVLLCADVVDVAVFALVTVALFILPIVVSHLLQEICHAFPLFPFLITLALLVRLRVVVSGHHDPRYLP
jgi:glucose-6-phosphate-specific signal transduction histidine kinase